MKSCHSVNQLCKVLKVSVSGYYGWRERREIPCQRNQKDQELLGQIRNIFQENRCVYGSPRIHQALRAQGHCHGRKRVARLMRQGGIQAQHSKRWRMKTTDSNHDQPVAPNRLLNAQAPTRSNEVWIGDITYVSTDEGWLYLAGIVDLYSRRVVGWAMSDAPDTQLSLAAWKMACLHRRPDPGLLYHSDRGVQYASAAYRQALEAEGALPSMSRRANCYDNAAMESFWSTLKRELIHPMHFRTHAEARSFIFDYIESFYNRRRLHSAIGYKSPMDFELQNN